jgi:hypothetical protein
MVWRRNRLTGRKPTNFTERPSISPRRMRGRKDCRKRPRAGGAGGQAGSSLRLSYPSYVSGDGQSLYIASTFDNVIFKLIPSMIPARLNCYERLPYRAGAARSYPCEQILSETRLRNRSTECARALAQARASIATLSGASRNCHGHSGINAGGCAGDYAPGSVIRAMSELSWSRSKMICLPSGETSKPVVE